MNRDGIPLPSALSGNIIERLVRVDEALFYLILGAMAELTDDWFLEQTGALTVDDARVALMEMMWCLQEGCKVREIGEMAMFPGGAVPDRWMTCTGDAISRSVYSELFDVIGTTWGAGNGTTTFNIPDMRDKLPMGVLGSVVTDVGDSAGALTHTLSTGEIPSHNHTLTDPGHVHSITDPGHAHRERQFAGASSFIAGAAGGANPTIANGTNTTNTAVLDTVSNTTGIGVQSHSTGVSLAAAGGGGAHSILNPVKGVHFMIYTGVL